MTFPNTFPQSQETPFPVTSKVSVTTGGDEVMQVPTSGVRAYRLVGILGSNRLSSDVTATVTVDDVDGNTFRLIRLEFPHDSTLTWDPGGGTHYIMGGELMQAVASSNNAVDLLFSFEQIT